MIQEESSRHFHLWFFLWSSQVIERYRQPSLEKIRRIMADYREKPVSSAEWRELEESIEVIRRCWRGK